MKRKATTSLINYFFNVSFFSFSDKPFTIFAPKNSAETRDDSVLHQPDVVKKLLLDHVILGSKVDLTNTTGDISFKTLTGKTVKVKYLKEGKLEANGAKVLVPKVEIPNGVLVILDNYLFPEERKGKNGSQANLDLGMLSVVTAKEERKSSGGNGSFVESVLQVLSLLRSGVRVFHHFLSRSNVSQLVMDGKCGATIKISLPYRADLDFSKRCFTF